MIVLIKATYFEILKIFNRLRTYIGFATIVILVPIIMYLAHRYGFETQDQALRSLGDSVLFVGTLVNGLLVSYYLMNVLWVHFPFFIVLVSGDIMAGEGAAGTFRILMTRPISRFQIITAKFLATFFYTFTIVFFLGIISVGLICMEFLPLTIVMYGSCSIIKLLLHISPFQACILEPQNKDSSSS